MVPQSDRETFRLLVIRLLALEIAEQLGELTFPPPERLEHFREIAAPKADQVIHNYEKAGIVEAVREDVVSKLRDDLVPRSRVARLIEVAINVSVLVIGALIGLSQIIFDPRKNAQSIEAVYYVLMAVVVVQFMGNLYLKFFDSKR